MAEHSGDELARQVTPRRPPRPWRPGALGQVAARGAAMLTLACERCERRLSAAWLIEGQGSTRRGSRNAYEPCGAHWAGLAAVFGV